MCVCLKIARERESERERTTVNACRFKICIFLPVPAEIVYLIDMIPDSTDIKGIQAHKLQKYLADTTRRLNEGMLSSSERRDINL